MSAVVPLRARADFAALFRRGARLRGEYLQILHRKNGRAENRLAMAFSRKRARRAVLRNRLRRVIRARFALATFAEPLDALVTPLRTLTKADDKAVALDIERLLARLQQASPQQPTDV